MVSNVLWRKKFFSVKIYGDRIGIFYEDELIHDHCYFDCGINRYFLVSLLKNYLRIPFEKLPLVINEEDSLHGHVKKCLTLKRLEVGA